MIHRFLIALSLMAVIMPVTAHAQTGPEQRISNFKDGSTGWRSVRIDKKVPATKFTLKRIEGVAAVEAYARKSIAIFTRPLMADLSRTPVLCWRWRVSNTIKSADISKKSGDDQAARILIGLDLPNSSIPIGIRAKLALARTAGGRDIPDGAINYVWDNLYPVGTARDNVYTRQNKIIVTQTGDRQVGQWVDERRNLAQDIMVQFKTSRARVTSIGISSDTDNSGETVRAAFADLHMVSANSKCRFR